MQRFYSFIQFTKFAIVGVVNTVIDLGILTVLLYVFGVGWSPYAYPIFKSISFIVAVINSYTWNRKWVFSNANSENKKTQVFFFFMISVVGIAVNIVISSAIFASGSYLFPDLNHVVMGDIAAIFGSACVLVSNFFGYKYLVFRPSKLPVT